MKKTFVLIAIAALALAACTKEEPGKDAAPVKTILSIGADPTKTTIGDLSEGRRPMYWADGDQVRANGVISNALENVPANSTRMDFSFTESVTAPYNTVYPASIYKDATTVTLPHNAGDQVIPLGGVSQTTSMTLSPLTAVLQLKIKQPATDPDTDNIVLIEVSTASTRMSGDFSIDYSTGELTAAASPSGDDLKVQITGDWALSADETSFFIPVPAGSYNFEVKIVDKNGHFMTKATTSPKTFVKGIIQPLKAFEFKPTSSGGLEIDTPEKLIAFATAYNRGDYEALDKNLIATVTADLAFDSTTSAAFNATGGIGTSALMFNGTFDGGNHTISGLQASVPLFSYVGSSGTVEKVILGSTSSVTHSAAVTSALYLGAIAGYSEGDILNCENNAPVSCTSSSYLDVLYIGGIVGRQNTSGTISGCNNSGSVSCTATGGDDKVNVYIGGVAGSVERPGTSDSASIENSRNSGSITANPLNTSYLHVGGVVGWINSVNGNSPKMTISGLVNTGDVTRPNAGQMNDYPVLAAGLIGGIHGASISSATGDVVIKDSHVSNCTIQNGSYNNKQGYGTASHTGGLVGVARGDGKNITFSDNCYVKNVFVNCRRGFAGGFVSWTRGASITDCSVLNSSVRGSLAQCWYAGGIAGCAYDSDITNCTVVLTKEASAGNAYDTYTLYANGNGNGSATSSMAGGIVAQARGALKIEGCRAYIKKMYQGTTGKEAFRGWIVGYIDDNSGSDTPSVTIKNCGIGGTCASAPAVTIDDSNVETYLYGSCSAGGAVSVEGTNYLWDGSDAPTGNTIVEITIAEYAPAHGWTGTTNFYNTVEQDGVILTASANPGSSNGNYNTQWRFYQARGGGLNVSVPSVRSLVKITFTYSKNNNGVVIAPDGSTQLPSGSSWQPSGTSVASADFTIGQSTPTSGENGRVDFTKIVVEYE